jgi:hydroxymethylpyrimidine pyrophosphatase-like HAD family hydrolase
MTFSSLATADLSQVKMIAVDIDGTLTLNGRFSPQLLSTACKNLINLTQSRKSLRYTF